MLFPDQSAGLTRNNIKQKLTDICPFTKAIFTAPLKNVLFLFYLHSLVWIWTHLVRVCYHIFSTMKTVQKISIAGSGSMDPVIFTPCDSALFNIARSRQENFCLGFHTELYSAESQIKLEKQTPRNVTKRGLFCIARSQNTNNFCNSR
jgi:hypothetical protein